MVRGSLGGVSGKRRLRERGFDAGLALGERLFSSGLLSVDAAGRIHAAWEEAVTRRDGAAHLSAGSRRKHTRELTSRRVSSLVPVPAIYPGTKPPVTLRKGGA